MKIFVVTLLACVALSSAEINSQLGYNYNSQQPLYPLAQQQQQQQPVIMQILTAQPQSPPPQQQQQQQQLVLEPSQQYLPSVQQHQQQQIYQQPQQTHSTAPLIMALPMPSTFPGVTRTHSSRRYRPRVKMTKKPIVTKNFFIHSAPEDTDEDIQEELAQLHRQPRKHYNVLFVKTPAQTSKAAALNLAKALKEEKTVVYVLSKKTTATDLQDAISDEPQHINKPEVFFIKYRTPEEAANAQRQIQSQYDSLGGTSTITDEGVAPITSVVGSLDVPEEEPEEEGADEQGGQQDQNQNQQYNEQLVSGVSNPSQQYLPPSRKY